MPIAYFDSSVLLSILLQEERATAMAELWDSYPERVSSILLGTECWIVMKRQFLSAKRQPSAGWWEERSRALDAALASLQIKPVDSSILEELRKTAALAECRTLDAIHLATALYYRAKSGEDLILVSLDDRMRKTAAKLKMKILPLAE
jgi:predicted nucleic acid-binding protein